MAKRVQGARDEWMHPHWLLDAVEAWATSLRGEYWMVRETEAGVVGRIDGLLVPASFDCHVFKSRRGHWLNKAGLVGVEVKASREDFLAGIRKAQFDRYADDLAGLYVATPRSVKTSEVPEHCGHLVVYRTGERSEWAAVCKRQPTYRDCPISPETMWQLIFRCITRMKQERREERKRVDMALQRVGSVAERQVISVLRKAAAEAGY